MGRRSDKIAGRKGKADAIKGKLYGRWGKKIVQCAKAGGADPIANSKLGNLLKEAKDLGIPRDIIERNLKKAADKSQADFSELCYEAYGPGGTGFVVECLTDNLNRTASDVKSTITKLGLKVAEPGSVMFNFERLGLLVVGDTDEDKVFEAALEAGALDVLPGTDEEGAPSDTIFKVFTPVEDFSSCTEALQSQGFKLLKEQSELVYRAPAAIEVDDEAFAKCEAAMDKLLELGDVDAVYTNCEGLTV